MCHDYVERLLRTLPLHGLSAEADEEISKSLKAAQNLRRPNRRWRAIHALAACLLAGFLGWSYWAQTRDDASTASHAKKSAFVERVVLDYESYRFPGYRRQSDGGNVSLWKTLNRD